MTSVETKDCETLDEFWDFISPIGETFGGAQSRFVFRGQSDSKWELVPKVFREEVLAKYKKTGMLSTLSDHPGQFWFEWYLLQGFVNFCDKNGLPIPNDSLLFRKYFSHDNITNIHSFHTQSWPEDDVIPLMALAQSHGIPTRLLDWSNNPFVACYFAAASAIEEDLGNDDRIALFAIDVNAIKGESPIKHIKVPGSISANLSAQGGSFILVENYGSRGDAFVAGVSLESKLTGNGSILRKVTLPKSLAGDLWFRCNKFGFSAATIYPGYDGAAKAVLEAFWANRWPQSKK